MTRRPVPARARPLADAFARDPFKIVQLEAAVSSRSAVLGSVIRLVSCSRRTGRYTS
jgi:hypothetical protein